MSVSRNLRATAPDRAGNNFRAARNLGTFTDTNVTFDDAIGGNDRADFFRFRVARSSFAAIALTGLRANADIDIFDNRQRRIGGLNNLGNRREFTFGQNTPGGLYYLRVFPRGAGNTTYRLTVFTITN